MALPCPSCLQTSHLPTLPSAYSVSQVPVVAAVTIVAAAVVSWRRAYWFLPFDAGSAMRSRCQVEVLHLQQPQAALRVAATAAAATVAAARRCSARRFAPWWR